MPRVVPYTHDRAVAAVSPFIQRLKIRNQSCPDRIQVDGSDLLAQVDFLLAKDRFGAVLKKLSVATVKKGGVTG